MTLPDQQGLNAAYAAQLLEDYLEAPASVPSEWRELFEQAQPAPSAPLVAPGNGHDGRGTAVLERAAGAGEAGAGEAAGSA